MIQRNMTKLIVNFIIGKSLRCPIYSADSITLTDRINYITVNYFELNMPY